MTTDLYQADAPPIIAFSGSALDRSDAMRNDAEALAALMTPAARLLRLDGLDPVLDADGALAWDPLWTAADDAELVLLGRDSGGLAHFAAVPADASASIAPPQPRLWQAMATMPPHELATYGTARSMVGWHARHRFCARCGAPTKLARAGWQRNCVNDQCKAEHFPRTDPVVIMTVEHDGDLLLGRQPRFPPRRFSALAGFIEPGESLEEAVAREVFEEVGLEVSAVHYVASQPWPFPASLMIACHAIAVHRDVVIDGAELDDARWFTRAEVRAAMTAAPTPFDAPPNEAIAFIAPPRHAVAWHLIDRWLRRQV